MLIRRRIIRRNYCSSKGLLRNTYGAIPPTIILWKKYAVTFVTILCLVARYGIKWFFKSKKSKMLFLTSILVMNIWAPLYRGLQATYEWKHVLFIYLCVCNQSFKFLSSTDNRWRLTRWSPAFKKHCGAVVMAAMPVENTKLPAPPSRAFTATSAASHVGLPHLR